MPPVATVKGGYVPGRTHPTDRTRGQTTAMPAPVAAPWQSCPDHPLVGMETAAPGPGHAVSLPETPSETCSSRATVIVGVLAHGHAGYAQFPGDGPQGQPVQPALLDRLPPGELGGRGRTLPQVRCLAGGVLRRGVLAGDGLGADSAGRTGSRAARRRCWDLLM